MTHRRDIIAALSALTLALAGCGSSAHHAATPPAAAGSPTTASAPASTASAAPATSPETTTAADLTPQPPAGGPVPAGFDPIAFTAVSERQFWLLGTAPCSHPVCTSIVRTTDGGAHFVGVPAPTEAVNLSGPGLDTLLFANPRDGYASSSQNLTAASSLWETHDGGAHWRRTRTDIVAFTVTSGHIYALTGSCHNGVCAQLRLARSPAAADDWSSVPLTLSASGHPSLAAAGTSVWVSLTPAAGTPSKQVLFVSRDGGRTLTRQVSACYAGLRGTLQASSPAVVWAVCPTGMEAGAWRTADAGTHWSGLHASGIDTGLANSAQLAPASDTAALLAPGGEMSLLRTTDAGASFTKVGFPAAGQSAAWFGFTDPSTASALVSGNGAPVGPNQLPSQTLWRSADGGVHWHSVHISG